MNLTISLINRYFKFLNQELYLGKVAVNTIVAKYGTPIYIYDRAILDRKWSLLRNTFPPEFSISYSIKANPHPFLLKYYINKGCGLEVASGGELFQALKAGCPPDRIVFAGPGKTETELAYAVRTNVGEIHVESLVELNRISTICQLTETKARIALRINPSAETQGGAIRMGGKSSPFGMDEKYVDAALEQMISDSFITFHGIHIFMGTQILDHHVILDQYRCGLELAKRIAVKCKKPLLTIDFGGGFGIPYFQHEKELNMPELGKGLKQLINEHKTERLLSRTNFMIEPGRYLVGEAGLYVMRINDIKISRGKKYLITDGGMHHHLAASGNLGQTIKRHFPIANLTKPLNAPSEEVDVVGPLCTPLDVVARKICLPQADIGDLLAVFQSGAYARTASPLGFLSHPSPPEVLVEEDQAYLIRRPGTYEDFLLNIPDLPLEHNLKA